MDNTIGELLATAEPDVAKIGLSCLVRAACLGLVLLVGYAEQGFNLFWLGMFLAFAAFAFWPMRHLRDKIEFFSNGIAFHQKQWTLESLGEVRWVAHKSRTDFFEGLYMDTDAGRFALTYVKHPKKQFNRAYGKQMNGAKISWN